ncbi:MAG: GtrA family protein [Actinomycetota bacterium]|nr:GtrA family protein [Actinomycetota bacterium]
MIVDRVRATVATRERLSRFVAFALVGLSGLVVNQVALWWFTETGGLHYLLSAVIATQLSSLWNFVLIESFVFRGNEEGRLTRLAWFLVMNNAWLLLRGPVLVLLTEGIGIGYLMSNAIAIGMATVVRFLVADDLIWRQRGAQPTLGTISRYSYDIHGIVRIVSDARLPELSFFRVEEIDGPPDIDICVSGDGFGGPRTRRLVERGDHAVRYVEQLGRFGFAVDIRMADPSRVQVSRPVARSPHVLYTNVAEPLLRWTFVRKGYALVHAACLEMDGKGTLITAQTDTGKTTTCLMSVQQHGAGFVSDDMVIIDGDGMALAFPKPLTISAHTLAAARTAPLPWRRRCWLQVQSRLHSKSGRRTGLALSKVNLPVCTMNAWVQRLIPPPKFTIEELVPSARIVPSVRITHMGVIERGSTLVQPLLDLDSNVLVLRENTEDAYGFPPYPLIAAVLANGDVALEDEVRRHLLDGLPVTRIRTSDRHWYEQLMLLTTETPFAVQTVNGELQGARVADPGTGGVPVRSTFDPIAPDLMHDVGGTV